MVLESYILICSCVGWHEVCPFNCEDPSISEAAFIQLSLGWLLPWVCRECSDFRVIRMPFTHHSLVFRYFLHLLSKNWEHPPWVLTVGQGGVLKCCTKSLIIHWKVCKGGVTPRGLILWLPVLFLHPVIEPACFSDIMTQLALCYNQCFHSFPK